MKAIIVYRNGSTFDCGVVEQAAVLCCESLNKRCFSYLKLDSKTTVNFSDRADAAACVIKGERQDVPFEIADIRGWAGTSSITEYAVKLESKDPENGVESVVMLFGENDASQLNFAVESAVLLTGWNMVLKRISPKTGGTYIVALNLIRNSVL